MTFFALALGAFVAMFTGQLLAFPVYYVVVNYLYVGCWYLINMVIESVCFGVSNNWNPGKSCILSPIYYLTNNLRIQSVENSEYVTVGIEFKGAYLLGIYAVAGVVFLIAAYQLYKRRKLETAGDLISMRGIKPVFRWGVAVCAGLLGGNAVADTIGNSFSSAKVHFWILAAGTLHGTIISSGASASSKEIPKDVTENITKICRIKIKAAKATATAGSRISINVNIPAVMALPIFRPPCFLLFLCSFYFISFFSHYQSIVGIKYYNVKYSPGKNAVKK